MSVNPVVIIVQVHVDLKEGDKTIKAILQNFAGQRTLFLYPSEESREEIWNSLTPTGRKKYGWKKVLVKITEED